MISPIRAVVERGVTFFDTAQLYGPFAKDGRQMVGSLNQTRLLGTLHAHIISERRIV
jgi:aryl-alcohol dehydrogenase-like predicted oxidoreductase